MFKVKWLLGICILYMLGVLGLIVYAIITPATTTTLTSTGIVSTNAVSSIPSQTTSTTSTTSTNFNDINSASSTSANGLSLSLALDSTTYQPGQQVAMAVDVKNILSVENDVPVSDNWSYANLEIGPCDNGPGGFGYPYGIAIFQGNYTSLGLSNATPLALYDYSVLPPCPGPMPSTAFDFKPLSDIATIISGSSSFPDSTVGMNTQLAATGYWTGVRPDTSGHGFGSGVYTVVGGDEWGNLVILHFTVTQDTNGDNSVSSLSINGLSLSLVIDATIYRPGEEVTITIDEKNTLSTQNNVPTAEKWSISGLSVNPCGTDAFPLGIAIFQGNYTVKNISSATPLNIYNPIETWICSPRPAIKEYDFLPSNDSVAQIIDGEPNSQTFAMKQSVSASSYWTVTNQNLTQYELHDFEPGVYTVVAGDEWGAIVVLHFTVSQ